MMVKQWAVGRGQGAEMQCSGVSSASMETLRPVSAPPLSALRFPLWHFSLPPLRRGISLLEVLISMFVLLFGLMGVAAVFPVGNHYAGKGEQYDRGAALADAAFADLKARRMLNPTSWLYAKRLTSSEGGGLTSGSAGPPPIPDLRHHVIRPTGAPAPGSFNATTSKPPLSTEIGAGHAFVLDPMGMAEAAGTPELYTFPFGRDANPWIYSASEPRGLNGIKWPIRRVTLPATIAHLPNMPPQVAETICRLRDDLANETPEQDDRPGIYRYSAADPNGTPNNPTDDVPLARAYAGNFSWLATVVPTASPTGIDVQIDYPVNLLQPSRPEYSSALYDVSVAVFHKREETPSAESERMLAAELFVGAELVVYADNAFDVDDAVLDIRPSQWILLAGVQPSGKFLLKWYKILSMDDETADVAVDADFDGSLDVRPGRRLTLDGPDWPSDTLQNLRAILLPGVIGVSTQSLPMERN